MGARWAEIRQYYDFINDFVIGNGRLRVLFTYRNVGQGCRMTAKLLLSFAVSAIMAQ